MGVSLTQPKSGSRFFRTVLGGVLILVVGVGVGWAGSLVFMPEPAVKETASTLVTVEHGSIESSIPVNARVTWPRQLIAVNSAAGTVTAAPDNSAEPVQSGDILYEVDLRPVFAVPGAVPGFRDLYEGLEGRDVAQLQEFLAEQEFLVWFTAGVWEGSTTTAVKLWQEANGINITGMIAVGDIVFVPNLPTRLVVEPATVRLGARLQGGEEVIFGLGATPDFVLPITSTQAALMPTGTRVEVSTPDGDFWNASIVEHLSAEESSGVDLLLGALNGDATICGQECDKIKPDAEGVLLRSKAVIVDRVEGLVVASAALTTDASGATIVIDEDGNHHIVEVIAGARGMTAITGVSEGLRVVAPAEAP